MTDDPRGVTDAAIGTVLVGVGALTCLVRAAPINVVFTIDSAGANHVIVPVVYWVVAAGAAFAIARRSAVPLSQALAHVFVIALVTHLLLLLAVSASWVTDRASYSTALYWLYARAFYAAIVGASFGWTLHRALSAPRRVMRFAVLPIAIAAIVLAVVTLRHDPAAGVAGMAIGAAAGAVLTRPGRGTSTWLAGVHRIAADERLFLTAVFVLALALRLIYAARVMTDPNYIETGGDARFYDRLAVSYARGEPLVNPGYPLLILGYVRFLAIVYRVFGHSYAAVCVVQAVIGAAAAVGIYAIGKPVFGVVASRVAAVFTAVSFQLIFSAVAIGHQALDIGVTVLLIWLLIGAVERVPARWWAWAAAGAVFGWAIAIRETNAFFLLFAYAWLFWAMRRARRPHVWRAVVSLTAGATVVLAPLVVPMVATTERRLALRKHMDRLATSNETKGREGLAKPLSDPQRALQQLREQPGFVLRAEATAVKNNFAVQFFTQPYGEFDVVSLRKESDYYYGVWCYAYLLTLGGMGVAIGRVRAGDSRSAALALMLGLLVFRTIPHLFLESGYRHRAPLEPFLILFCAAGVVAVLQAAWPPRASVGPTLQAAS